MKSLPEKGSLPLGENIRLDFHVVDAWLTRTFRRFMLGLAKYTFLLLLAWFSYLLINHHLLSTVRVAGVSMRPTLLDADVRLLHRWAYLCRAPQRGDIVVIKDPADDGYSIKRIIAIPGDRVEFHAGRVYLNGCQCSEPYLTSGTPTYYPHLTGAGHSTVCGSGEYYLMGDNRMNSLDSRYYGPVTRSRILGAVFL